MSIIISHGHHAIMFSLPSSIMWWIIPALLMPAWASMVCPDFFWRKLEDDEFPFCIFSNYSFKLLKEAMKDQQMDMKIFKFNGEQHKQTNQTNQARQSFDMLTLVRPVVNTLQRRWWACIGDNGSFRAAILVGSRIVLLLNYGERIEFSIYQRHHPDVYPHKASFDCHQLFIYLCYFSDNSL